MSMNFQDIFKKIDENEKNEKQIIQLLTRILTDLEGITEFNERELKAISILETDPFFKEYLDFYILNKKHIKRKHSKEILEALKTVASSLSFGNNQNPLGGVMLK